MAMSRATAAFADAMEVCATYVLCWRVPRARLTQRDPCRLKGPNYETGTRLQAASGLHHLMGNHWHVMVCLSLPASCFEPLLNKMNDMPRPRPLISSLRSLSANIWIATRLS